MEHFYEILKELVNPESIIRYGGLYLLLFVVFAETGLFFGFFLPGDSLMFTAGLLCATGILELHIVNLLIFMITAAVSGNMIGYLFGKKVGVLLFKRKSGFFFRQEHLLTARDFYQKHGGKAIVLSRFLPIVRTFAPIIAGIVELDYRKFFIYNVVGGVAWVSSLVLCGYFLGKYVPESKEYLKYIVIFLILITSIPFLVNSIKKKKKKKV
jgi:membrane-associated protein